MDVEDTVVADRCVCRAILHHCSMQHPQYTEEVATEHLEQLAIVLPSALHHAYDRLDRQPSSTLNTTALAHGNAGVES